MQYPPDSGPYAKLSAEEKKKRLAAGGGKSAKGEEEPESVLGGVSPAMPSQITIRRTDR